jgi:uncharacterized protein YraI
MSKLTFLTLMVICIALAACTPAVQPTAAPIPNDTATFTAQPSDTATNTPLPSDTPLPTLTPTATFTETPSPIPTVESLSATVNTNLVSCRYGPGSEYLYLDAFKQDYPLTLLGQTGGNNWVMVYDEGFGNCWVNVNFLNIEGDFKTLPVAYPEPVHIPMTSRYPPTTVISATRDGNNVTVTWLAVPVGPGDFEDAEMFIYIIEVWRCEGGQLIFDPLASNRETVTFVDEPGCVTASHGRVFVQEKHGYTRPAEIPWP